MTSMWVTTKIEPRPSPIAGHASRQLSKISPCTIRSMTTSIPVSCVLAAARGSMRVNTFHLLDEIAVTLIQRCDQQWLKLLHDLLNGACGRERCIRGRVLPDLDQTEEIGAFDLSVN